MQRDVSGLRPDDALPDGSVQGEGHRRLGGKQTFSASPVLLP